MRYAVSWASLIIPSIGFTSAHAGDSTQFVYVSPEGAPYLTITVDSRGDIAILRGHVAQSTDPCSSEEMVICTGNFFLPVAIPRDLETRREWEYGYYSYSRSESATAIRILGRHYCAYRITTAPLLAWQGDLAAERTWTFMFSLDAGLLMAAQYDRDGATTQLFYSQDVKGWGAASPEEHAGECGP